MSVIVGRELKYWCDSLNVADLNDYEITVVNIIINHYSDLMAAGGTANGKRANKFVEYVNDKKGICDKKLDIMSVGTIEETGKIKRLKKLSLDSFRGFAVSRDFDLNKQYVFLYGPNGSGKSSFSEALEYGLLGAIQEAEASKIKVSNYIKNTSTGKGKHPQIVCIYEDDTEGNVVANYELYRFAFVEKNRISDFSHISVLNSKTQSERISALFGLSVFNDFVQGFTLNFDDKYLPVKSVTEDSFKERKALRDSKENQMRTTKEELKNIQNITGDTIKKLDKSEIIDIDVALDYLQHPQKGILTIKIAEREKNHKELLIADEVDVLKNNANEIFNKISFVIECRNKLCDKAMQVNYKKLYEAIGNLQETDTCPACGTPMEKAIRNPYIYAREQLNSFSELEEIQKNIRNYAKDIKLNIQEMLDFLTRNTQLIHQLNIDMSDAVSVDIDEIESMNEKVIKWKTLCRNISDIDRASVITRIDKYNDDARKSNELYEEQVKNFSELSNQLLTLKTQMGEKRQQIELFKKEIEEFDNQSAETLKKIKQEKDVCKFNEGIIKAYAKIINNIILYNNELPKKIAKNLEEKIIDYYNVINQDDADFERIKEIVLPDAESDKLIIIFKDGSKAEALQVLSEGHIKILGLSILLAKAVHDKLNFIVFDDIVNAIDDDHRNGVADLLMNHTDFRDIQIILSTHGDQFIVKLQDKLGKSRYNKAAITYKFIPADSLMERGVIAEYSDAKAPLDAAEKKYAENEIKDSASKCRQAMECIAYNLWNVIAKTPKNVMTVKSPQVLKNQGLRGFFRWRWVRFGYKNYFCGLQSCIISFLIDLTL
ncbi:MAG: AAA family ATPase [Ruminococcus flavefaciens]|nr:AAA family ATPase [Ruminococcus flavefaciens]